MYVLGHLYKQVQDWNGKKVNVCTLDVNTLDVTTLNVITLNVNTLTALWLALTAKRKEKDIIFVHSVTL